MRAQRPFRFRDSFCIVSIEHHVNLIPDRPALRSALRAPLNDVCMYVCIYLLIYTHVRLATSPSIPTDDDLALEQSFKLVGLLDI